MRTMFAGFRMGGGPGRLGALMYGGLMAMLLAFSSSPVNAGPSLSIQKQAGGQDADVTPGPLVRTGDPVNFSYFIKNTGDMRLINIVVSDSQALTVTLPKTSLNPGESMTGTATGTALPGQQATTGTVKANVGKGRPQPKVSASDLACYFGVNPAPAPGGLEVTDEGTDTVSLAWEAVSGAQGYNVYRSTLSGQPGTKINAAPLADPLVTDLGLMPGTPYYYTVTALNLLGDEGSASAEVCGIPHYVIGWANLQWPPTITHTISTIDRTDSIYGQVWIDGVTSQAGPMPGLRAQVGFGPDGTDPASNPAWVWVDATFNTDAGNNDEFQGSLLPEVVGTFDYAYRYSTTAGRDWLHADLDGTGNGYAASQAGALTVLSSGDTTPPATPENLRVESAWAAGVSLAWDAVGGDPSLYGYEVLRRQAPDAPFQILALVTAPEYVDSAVETDETYLYVVRSVDYSWNRSAASAEVSATPSDRTVTITLNVTVPATTEGVGLPVHIAGSLNGLDGDLPAWNPAATPLTRVDATHWTITLTGKEGTTVEYKYTLGSWNYVEKGGLCDELNNRSVTLVYGVDGILTVNDTVVNWRNVAPCGD